MRYVSYLITLFIAPASVLAADAQWSNQCPSDDILICANIGKTAFNATGPEAMREVPLGTIQGVTYRPAGSLVGTSDAIADAGISESVRLAPDDGWYYIINDAPGAKPFLRWSREIQPR